MAGRTEARRVTAAERRRQAWELRKAGATLGEIAKAVGYAGKSGVHKALSQALAEAAKDTAATAQEARTLELERLDRLLRAVWPQATQGHLGAVKQAAALIGQRAKLLGLDVTRTELSGPGGGPVELAGVVVLPALSASVEEWKIEHGHGPAHGGKDGIEHGGA